VPAHPYLLLPRLVVTPGGSIAAVGSKHQLPPDWQFATHTLILRPTFCYHCETPPRRRHAYVRRHRAPLTNGRFFSRAYTYGSAMRHIDGKFVCP
jgi:hypothetical protein